MRRIQHLTVVVIAVLASTPPVAAQDDSTLRTDAEARFDCSLRADWAVYTAAAIEAGQPRRYVNWISVDAEGNRTWNGGSIRHEDLVQFLRITGTMSPHPILVVNQLPDAPCGQVDELMEFVEFNIRCAPDHCLAASGPDGPFPRTPPPPPPSPPRR